VVHVCVCVCVCVYLCEIVCLYIYRHLYGNKCVVLRMGLLRLFHGEADPVDLVLQHYYHGASGWTRRTLTRGFLSCNMGPQATSSRLGTKLGASISSAHKQERNVCA
jgi:hypothetical protein